MYWFLICFFFSIHFNSAMAQTSEPQLITLSGTGSLGYNGDDQAATQAQINYPQGLAVDQAGNVYIADSHNQRIRKINPQTGIITTVAGNGGHGYSGNNNQATQAELGAPLGVFIDTNNNLFIADTENNRIRKVDAQTNVITTIAGTGIDGYSGDGGPATQATFWHPQDVFVTNTGDIFVADTKNNCIRKIDAQTGIITTVAGTGQYGYSGDDSLATQASLAYPSAVWVTNTGDIYIVDRSNHRIRKVDAQTGIITTIGPTKNNLTPLNSPSDIVIDENGAFYVSDSWHNQILKLEDNTYSIVAGTGQPGFTEGNPLQASLNYPSGIAIDNNTLYVTDRFNHSIRSITNINQIVTRPVLLDTISKFYQPQRPPPPKTAPIAIPDTVEVKPNSRINVYVLRNDYDNEGDPLTVTTTTQGTHSERVVINDNDTIHYRPLPNYEDEDQFSYTISDGKGGTATAQVLITVIDRPPFVNRSIPFQSFFLNENANIDLGGSRPVIYDPQDEPLRLSATSQDSTIVIPTINGYQLTLTGQKAGLTTIQVTGTDSIGQSASTQFGVRINDPAPQIGIPTPEMLFYEFEKKLWNRDLIAITGPVTVDTLGGYRQGYQYLSSLSLKMPENAIRALRRNYDPLSLWQLQTNVRFKISLENIIEQEDIAQIDAHMFFGATRNPTPQTQPFIDRPPVPIKIQLIKISSGWVIDNVPEILNNAAQMIGTDQWPKVTWQMPDLIISQNSPPITINLNHDPQLFQDPTGGILIYKAKVSFISGFQGITATIQDTLLTLTPRPWGDHNNLIITASNTSDGTANMDFLMHIKREVPITVSDTAQVKQDQHIDISVLENDRPLTNETLRIVSATQGAKSQTIEILNGTQIRYTPKANATGTDRFTYRIDDGKGNQADGFVFMFIQPKNITPDFNTDGKVDFSDFIIFAAAFGSNDPNYDLNGDGQVSFPDFIIFGSAFGN